VFLVGLIEGASVVLLRVFEAGAALDFIERFGCTSLVALPACLQLMVEEQSTSPRNVSTLRDVLVGGDSVSAALQHRVAQQLHVETQEVHGMTEVLPTTVNRHGAVRVGSIGQAANSELRIVDPQGNDVEPGESGELLVRSPASSIGYWNDPEATAKLFEGGWLHTGDLCARDEDGYLWFKGRLKQIIIRGGSNISPQEVEEVLYQHAAVLEAGVVGLPDATFGEIPVAFVALKQGRKVEPKDLIAHVREQLSDYKTPDRIYCMEELPKGLTGKVDRRRLREILLADADLIESDAKVRV
jgi:long-chain acyl-CoA synthetase